jgi:DnaJ domain
MSDAHDPGRWAALSALGLSPDATPQEIVSAYRRLARSSHPDVAGVGVDAAAFARICDAYRYLSRESSSLPPVAELDSDTEGDRPAKPGSAAQGLSPVGLSDSWHDDPPLVAGPVIVRPIPPESR